jgi:hypothetical protein
VFVIKHRRVRAQRSRSEAIVEQNFLSSIGSNIVYSIIMLQLEIV